MTYSLEVGWVRHRVMQSWQSVPILIAFAVSACGQSASSDSGSGRGAEATGGQAGAATGGVSSAGAGSGGAGSGGAAGGGAPTTVDVSGPWAMFPFEDPVAVLLSQDGTTCSGTGCYGGLGGFDSCSPIVGGSIVGRSVKFAFAVPLGGPYAADVFVSADGTRMAGAFHDLVRWGGPTTWVPLESGESWLPTWDSEISGIVSARAGSYSISLNGAGPIAGFSPGDTYSLALGNPDRPFLYGDLGAFWGPELSWNEAEQALRAGPVPETHPELPTELRLRFDDVLLLDVAATFPPGETASFAVVPK